MQPSDRFQHRGAISALIQMLINQIGLIRVEFTVQIC